MDKPVVAWKASLSPEFNRSLVRGAWIAFLLFVFSGLVLDGPVTLQITGVAFLGYLGGVAVMAVRRPQAPTLADLWLIELGFVPLWIATQVCARWTWTWMGRL